MYDVAGDVLDAAFEASGHHPYLLVVEGRWGGGRTSFIEAAVVKAQMRDVDVVRLDVTDLARGSSGLSPCAFDRYVEDAAHSDPQSIAAAVEKSRQSPMLIAVDDAQWLDDRSAEALVVLHDHGTPGLLLVMTMLPSHAASPFVRRLATSTHRRTLHLEPLARDDLRELVTAHYFPAASDRDINDLHELTDGIPYFVHEVCSWADVEELELDTLAASMSDAVPPSLLKSTRSRLDALDDIARRVTGVLAVLDTHATPARAAVLGAVSESRVYDTIHTLDRYGLVDQTWPLRFGPPVLHYAILQSMPVLDRQTLRRRVAQLLHDEGEAPRFVARHLLDTPSAGGAHWIVSTCSIAADRALMRGDHALAVALLNRALAEPPAPGDHGRLLTELGRVEAMLGRSQAAEHLLDALDLSTDPGERGLCFQSLARIHINAGDPGGAVGYLRKGLERSGPPSASSRLMREELRVIALIDPTLHAIRPSNRRGDAAMATVVDHLNSIMAAEPADRVVRDLCRATEMADPATWEGLSMHAAVAGLVWCDAYDDAQRILDAADRPSPSPGTTVLGALRVHRRAVIAYHLGELDGALELARSAVGGLRETWPGLSHVAVAFGIHSAIECDQLPLARELAESAQVPPHDAATATNLQFLDAVGRLHLTVGELDGAIVAFRHGATIAEKAGIVNPAVAGWRGGLARALYAKGDHTAALRLALEEVEVARRFGAPRTLASALCGLGQVAAPEAAVPALREAAALLEHQPARLERVRVQYALTQALRRVGHRREACDEAHLGLAEAWETGARRLARLLEDEARTLGLRSTPRGRPIGLESLTPSERRVAELAISGSKNREIAAQLFVSVKTVEYHLGNVYSKLGIHGRRELPADLVDRRTHADTTSERVTGIEPA